MACRILLGVNKEIDFKSLPLIQDPGLFVRSATAALDKVKSTFCQRGTEYHDTWQECPFIVMKAVAKKLGVVVPDDAWRAMAAAAFVDMKHQRLQGGWKVDSVVDGIAYAGFLSEEVEAVVSQREAVKKSAQANAAEILT